MKDGGEWRLVIEGYGRDGLSVGSEAMSIEALVDEDGLEAAQRKQQYDVREQIELKG